MESACSRASCNLTALGGLRPATIVKKLSERTRCPCASMPADTLIVDGGVGPVTKGAGFDALELLDLQPQWRALSFEPLPSNCRSASTQLMRFGKRSRLLCMALSDQEGTSSFAAGSDVSGTLVGLSGSLEKRAQGASSIVRITTLDAHVAPNDRIFLLKLDVQGAEMHALRGAERLLREQRVSWIFLEFDPLLLARASNTPSSYGAALALLRFLRAHGFACRNARSSSYQPWLCNGDVINSTTGRRSCWTDLLCGHASVAEVSVGNRERGAWGWEIVFSHCRRQHLKHSSSACKDLGVRNRTAAWYRAWWDGTA